MERRKIGIEISPELKQRVKVEAAARGITMASAWQQATEAWLGKDRKTETPEHLRGLTASEVKQVYAYAAALRSKAAPQLLDLIEIILRKAK